MVLAGLVTGWAIAIPIGAVGALLVALTARTSVRTGSAAAMGVATVDGRMIENLHVEQAERALALAAAIKELQAA